MANRYGKKGSDSVFDGSDDQALPQSVENEEAKVEETRTLRVKGRLTIHGVRFDTGKATPTPAGWTEADDSPVTITEKGGRTYAQLGVEGKLIIRGILVDNARMVDVTDWARSDLYDLRHPFEATK